MATSGLGNLLVEEGLLTEQDRRTIVETSGPGAAAFAKAILALGLLDADELSAFLAERTPFKVVSKNIHREARSDVLGIVDLPLLAKLEVMPLRLNEGVLTVAMPDPLDRETMRQLEFFTGFKIKPMIATFAQVYDGLRRAMPSFAPKSSPLEQFLTNHVDAAMRRLHTTSAGGPSLSGGKAAASRSLKPPPRAMSAPMDDHHDDHHMEHQELDAGTGGIEDSLHSLADDSQHHESEALAFDVDSGSESLDMMAFDGGIEGAPPVSGPASIDGLSEGLSDELGESSGDDASTDPFAAAGGDEFVTDDSGSMEAEAESGPSSDTASDDEDPLSLESIESASNGLFASSADSASQEEASADAGASSLGDLSASGDIDDLFAAGQGIDALAGDASPASVSGSFGEDLATDVNLTAAQASSGLDSSDSLDDLGTFAAMADEPSEEANSTDGSPDVDVAASTAGDAIDSMDLDAMDGELSRSASADTSQDESESMTDDGFEVDASPADELGSTAGSFGAPKKEADSGSMDVALDAPTAVDETEDDFAAFADLENAPADEARVADEQESEPPLLLEEPDEEAAPQLETAMEDDVPTLAASTLPAAFDLADGDAVALEAHAVDDVSITEEDPLLSLEHDATPLVVNKPVLPPTKPARSGASTQSVAPSKRFDPLADPLDDPLADPLADPLEDPLEAPAAQAASGDSRIATLNRALVSMSLASSPEQALRRLAEAYSRAGLRHGAFVLVGADQCAHLGEWHQGANASEPTSFEPNSAPVGAATAQSLEPLLIDAQSPWTPMAEAETISGEFPWVSEHDHVSLASVPTTGTVAGATSSPPAARLAVIASGEEAFFGSPGVRDAAIALLQHAAKKLA